MKATQRSTSFSMFPEWLLSFSCCLMTSISKVGGFGSFCMLLSVISASSTHSLTWAISVAFWNSSLTSTWDFLGGAMFSRPLKSLRYSSL